MPNFPWSPAKERSGDSTPAPASRRLFLRPADGPRPLVLRVTRRIRFSEVDPMQVVWHGRYAQFFEEANEELCRECGMSHHDFRQHRVLAPIVQLHIDYFAPLLLGEQAAIIAKMIWTDAARINMEYQIHRENGELATGGYTVQMFVDPSGQPLLASPAILEACRQRWRAGELSALQ